MTAPDHLSRIHVQDRGAQISYLGLIEDILATGLVSAPMVPAAEDGRARYKRGQQDGGTKLFEADVLTIERKGPLLEIAFWASSTEPWPNIRSHATPWDNVVTLSTAATTPVQQPRRRRGRYPRNVVKLTHGLRLREDKAERLRRIGSATALADKYAQTDARFRARAADPIGGSLRGPGDVQ